jgi:intron-binding protein aquarius
VPTLPARWEKFTASVSSQQHKGVGDLFPFKEFFADAPQPLFKGQSYDEVCYNMVNSVT